MPTAAPGAAAKLLTAPNSSRNSATLAAVDCRRERRDHSGRRSRDRRGDWRRAALWARRDTRGDRRGRGRMARMAGATAKERATILRTWFDLIMANQEDLARLMTLEQGKPLAESRGEVAYGASFIEWFAEEAKRVYGDTIPSHARDKRIVVIKQPIGVVGCDHAVEFPDRDDHAQGRPGARRRLHRGRQAASQTPFSALALAVLAERAGMPAGVLNVVTGSATEIGGELTSNPIVRKISFTGSTEVGKLLMAQCAATIKKVSLELGGNAPFIVFDDADLDAAVEGAIASKFRNTGQTCVCANRILVQDGVYDEFAEKLGEGGRRSSKVGHRARGRRHAGPADRHGGGRKGRRAHRGCRGEGRAGHRRRRAARAGRPLLRADRPDRRDDRHAGRARGDVRPGRAAVPVRDRSRGDRARQRHRVWSRGLFFRPRCRARVARRRGARVRHRRHQHRSDLDRGGAVRRDEGIRDRPRGLQVRHRGISRSEILVCRRNLAIRMSKTGDEQMVSRVGVFVIVGAAALGLSHVSVQAGQETTKTTWDGVYSAAQATKGEAGYNE